MKTPYNKKPRFKYCYINKRPGKIDLKALTSAKVKQNLLSDFSNTLDPSNPTLTADEIYSNLINTICISKTKTIPKLRNDKFASIWENDTVLNNHIDNLIAMTKNEAKHQDQIKLVKKSITKRKRFLKNQFYKKQVKKINKNAVNREMQQLFSNASNHELAFQKG